MLKDGSEYFTFIPFIMTFILLLDVSTMSE